MNRKLLSVTITSILACSAFAEERLADAAALERIVVSSDFRANDIQNVTASVSVIGSELIQARQAQHLEEILNLGANINFASGASRGRFIQIRGIGERSQFSEPINPSVGLVIDDFDFSGLAAIGTLFDVEQVEILRGPQATEFGAAGMAGTIKIKTAEADEQQSTKFTATLAQQDTWSLAGAHGGKITDDLYYRVAVNQFKSDGFVENIFLNRDDTDDLDEFTGRVKLKFTVSDSLTLDLNYQYFDIDNGYDAFSLDNDGRTRSDEPGFDRQETHALGFKVTQNLQWADITAVVNHSTSDISYGYDEDWTFVGFHPFEYSSFDAYFRERDVSSLDVRAISTAESLIFNGSTQWLLGFFAKDSEELLRREYTFADADFSSVYEPENTAIYAQTDTQFSQSLNFSFGLRVEKADIAYSDITGFVENNSDTLVGGKAVLKYTTGSAIVYTSVSRGFKAGGFNPDERVSQEQRIFEPEYNWNYEVGVKGHLDEQNAFIRLALFYMDRESTQISDFDTLTRDDGSTSFIDIIDNADNGTNWGLEFEGDWSISETVSLFASYGWLDATFSGYQLANGTFVDRQRQAQAPKHTFNLAATGYLNDQLSLRLEADVKDQYRFSIAHNERAPLAVLVNAQLRLELDSWDISFWAKNLFDRQYYVRGFGGFSNDPRDEYANPEPYYQLGDGRQFGITTSYQY